MTQSRAGLRGLRSLLAVVAVAAGLLGAAVAYPQGAAKPAAANRFIGAAKCKMCHSAKSSGDQYGHWKEDKHSKAYERLASAESKEMAKSKGIDDPQKAAECVKCHATAVGEPDDRLMRGFDRLAGVQCESCHGPGEKHMKARMAAAATLSGAGGDGSALQEVPKDEILGRPTLATCTSCHNEGSPSFKPFCYKKRLAEVSHFDPRKQRTKDQLDALKCGCGDACKCAKGECGDLPEGH